MTRDRENSLVTWGRIYKIPMLHLDKDDASSELPTSLTNIKHED